jgi:hypothetical protein
MLVTCIVFMVLIVVMKLRTRDLNVQPHCEEACITRDNW